MSVSRPGARAQSLTSRLAGLGPRRLGKVAAVLGLAVTAAFGGLDRVDPSVTAVKPGQSYDDGALAITVKRARLVPTLTAGDRVLSTAEPGSQYLAVVAALANDGTEPVPLGREIDLLATEATQVGAFRLADGTSTAYLGPGLSDEFAFVWQLPETVLRPGQTVSLRIWKKQYRELMVGSGKGWVDGTDYGVVELTAESRR